MVYVAGRHNSASDAVSRYPAGAGDTSSPEETVDSYVNGIAICALSAVDNLKTITWDKVEHACMSDEHMLRLTNLIQEGVPDDIRAWPPALKCYYRLRNDLATIGCVVLYKNRILIPASLRREVLGNLHSAHQGVSSMMSRAESSVFWPGISQDVQHIRDRCNDCNTMAPSQLNLPPRPLLYPTYPFELVCADYFMYRGNNFLVIVDRYSNWPTVIKTYDMDARTLIKALKDYSMIFGIPAELSSDGGPQFTAGSTKKVF